MEKIAFGIEIVEKRCLFTSCMCNISTGELKSTVFLFSDQLS